MISFILSFISICIAVIGDNLGIVPSSADGIWIIICVICIHIIGCALDIRFENKSKEVDELKRRLDKLESEVNRNKS